jgi:CheY-like chemotaxis protein
LKVIAISGALNGDFLSVATRLGAQAALRKPIDRVDLLQSVRQALNGAFDDPPAD